jgi:hypothetical protein
MMIACYPIPLAMLLSAIYVAHGTTPPQTCRGELHKLIVAVRQPYHFKCTNISFNLVSSYFDLYRLARGFTHAQSLGVAH